MPTMPWRFAEWQPSLRSWMRGLLFSTGIDYNAWLASAWCAGITVVGCMSAKEAVQP
jgi:hypothetical protein